MKGADPPFDYMALHVTNKLLKLKLKHTLLHIDCESSNVDPHLNLSKHIFYAGVAPYENVNIQTQFASLLLVVIV